MHEGHLGLVKSICNRMLLCSSHLKVLLKVLSPLHGLQAIAVAMPEEAVEELAGAIQDANGGPIKIVSNGPDDKQRRGSGGGMLTLLKSVLNFDKFFVDAVAEMYGLRLPSLSGQPHL